MDNQKTKFRKIKLRDGRKHHVKLPLGCRMTIEGKPTDGKPAVLLEIPEGTEITHETLTSPPDAA